MSPHHAYPLSVSEQDYLDGELLTDIKHEYIHGEVYAMAGAKAAHNRITLNISSALHQHLKGKTCQPYSGDMKVKVDSCYFYPDVLVDCSDLADDSVFTETPTIIVEVLSKSTRQIDRVIKREKYLQIPTLQEYILIEQGIAEIEVVCRSQNWQSHFYYLGDHITLNSIGLSISVEDIYDRVKNEDVVTWLEKKALAKQNVSN